MQRKTMLNMAHDKATGRTSFKKDKQNSTQQAPFFAKRAKKPGHLRAGITYLFTSGPFAKSVAYFLLKCSLYKSCSAYINVTMVLKWDIRCAS